MRFLLVALICSVFTGCGIEGLLKPSLGTADYEIYPIVGEGGEVVCCSVKIRNAKDYETLQVHYEKTPEGGVTLTLDEGGVDSSGPAAVQSQQNAKMLELMGTLLEKVPLGVTP